MNINQVYRISVRQLMTEFSTFFGTGVSSTPHEVIDRKRLVAQSGTGLYPAYTHGDIKACIDKIQPVRFREHIVRASFRFVWRTSGFDAVTRYNVLILLLSLFYRHSMGR